MGAYAEAEAEADPYLLYGGWTGYAGLPYGAYGYTGYAHHPYALSSVVKTVEVEPAKVEVKALAAPAVVAAAAPAALTYHHAAVAPVAYAGYAGYPYAHHLLGKREAEADADPAYFYRGYAGYGYAGYPYAGFYGGYPYAHGYAHAAAYAHAPSDPTNPHLVHTSRVGICTNYLGAQVPC